MLNFEKYNLNTLLNEKDYENKAIEYLKKYPCCDKNDCEHPTYQSNAFLWKDKNFQPLTEKIILILFDIYERKFNCAIKMWVYFQKKNSIFKEYKWHSHQRDFKNKEISFIVYLSDTDIGTVFKDKDDFFTLKPEKNCLYLWDSRYEHSPQLGKHSKNRIVIAGDCLIPT